jgi:hypothetical protein
VSSAWAGATWPRSTESLLTNISLLRTLLDQHNRSPLPPSSCRPSRSMREVLRILRRVVLDDEIDVGQVEPSSSDVRAEEEGGRDGC